MFLLRSAHHSPEVREFQKDWEHDALYGDPKHPFGGHLWFTFLKDGSGKATSGHYDLLIPSSTGSIKLRTNATLAKGLSPEESADPAIETTEAPQVIVDESPPADQMNVDAFGQPQGDVGMEEGDKHIPPPKLDPTLDNVKDISKIMCIHSHWHSLIFAGTKTWELRSTPWKFRGDVGIWSGSQVHGVVTIVGCQLVALKSETGVWEPYDDSEGAADAFVFADHNIGKHQVPMENLLLLGKSWGRIYAYTLENPREFSHPVAVKIKQGAQFVQTMDIDLWRAALSGPREPAGPAPQETLRVLGMSRKEALRLLDTDVTLLVKSQKSLPPGPIHIAIFEHGTAIIVGMIEVSGFRELRSLKALRKLLDDGYQHLLDENAKLFQPLRFQSGEAKPLYGWTIERKEAVCPPLIWKAESCLHVFRLLVAFRYCIDRI